MDQCIFCKIIKKEVPAKIVFEDDQLVVFPDINPSAKTHLLIVPKKHINSFKDLGPENGGFLVNVYQVASKLIEENNLNDDLVRVVVNGGKAQHIPHLHFHLLGGQWKRQI